MTGYEMKIKFNNGEEHTLKYNESMTTKVIFVRGIMEGVLPEDMHEYYASRYEDDDFDRDVKRPYFETMVAGSDGSKWRLYVHVDDIYSIDSKVVEGDF